MKPLHLVALALVAVLVSGCGSAGSTSARRAAGRLTDDERHRLYSAALAASESPLDSDTFKDVCREIGIFDAEGRPNDQYMAFVSQHVNWGVRSEAEAFRREINSKEKATKYIAQHLSTP